MKGVTRRARHQFSIRHFMQDPMVNRAIVRSHSLTATRGLEMTLTESSKSLSHSLSTKRVQIVRTCCASCVA